MQTLLHCILICAALCLAKQNHSASPVKVLVCTEALCPDCERFVSNELLPVYQLLGSEIMDLVVVPFGNAHAESDGEVQCQHGNGECDANIYELCAIYMNPDPKNFLPFMGCLAQTLPMGHHDEPFDPSFFEVCAKTVWWSGIQACHGTPSVVRRLIKAAADATPKAHKYVPWVEIDGVHMDEESSDFKTEVCKAYVAKAGPHPACSGEPLAHQS